MSWRVGLAIMLAAASGVGCSSDPGGAPREDAPRAGTITVEYQLPAPPRPLATTALWGPRGFARRSNGDVIVAESDRARLVVVGDSGEVLATYGGLAYDLRVTQGANDSVILYAGGLVSRWDGRTLDDDGRVVRHTIGGMGPVGVPTDGAIATATLFGDIGDLAATSTDIFLSLPTAGVVGAISFTDGRYRIVHRGVSPQGLEVDEEGRLVIADPSAKTLVRLEPDGGRTILLPVPGDSGSNIEPFDAVAVDGSLVMSNNAGPNLVVLDPGVSLPVDLPEGMHARWLGRRAGSALVADPIDHQLVEVTLERLEPTSLTAAVTEVADFDEPKAMSRCGDDVCIASWNGNQIIALDREGALRVVAGNGNYSRPDVDQLAVDEPLLAPLAVTTEPDGAIVFAQDSERAEGANVLRVSADGAIRSVNGADMRSPSAVLSTEAGLLVSDTATHQVFRIASDGVATVVAGDGVEGSSGDGGLATAARLRQPGALAVTSSGEILIVDRGNALVRAVGVDGRIRTVAGVRSDERDGLSGPWAVRARLGDVTAIAADNSDGFWFADGALGQVFHVDDIGRIALVAGGGKDTAADDRFRIDLGRPTALLRDDSDLLIADAGSTRILRLHDAGGLSG